MAAVKAMTDIKQLSKLSLSTAMQLFHNKISPIATYGLNHLDTPDEKTTARARKN